MNNIAENINLAKEYLSTHLEGKKPTIGLILGSGLGSLADEIEDAVKIPFSDIPGFLTSTVEGHQGQLVCGRLGGKEVIALQGRFHTYEGYSAQQVTIPVRVMATLGVEKLIITNAAGAINESLQPGDLMLITDHINFSGRNPLIGPNMENFGTRFPDTSESYSADLQKIAKECAQKENIELKEGVYQFSTGPTYETPAETRAARLMGADVVGMSTVPEVLVAVHSGISVLGITCVTNMAAGILDQPLDHQEVIETGTLVKVKFKNLILNILKAI